MSTNFPGAIDTFTNPQPTDLTTSPSHAAQHDNENDAILALENKVGTNGSATTSTLDYQIGAGWIPAAETWTYASADSPTFTFTITGDKTGKYSAGMRIKLTQTTAKYFLITAVSYSAPNTTVTVYGGTDYTLANAAITLPFYAIVQSPFGFPRSPI